MEFSFFFSHDDEMSNSLGWFQYLPHFFYHHIRVNLLHAHRGEIVVRLHSPLEGDGGRHTTTSTHIIMRGICGGHDMLHSWWWGVHAYTLKAEGLLTKKIRAAPLIGHSRRSSFVGVHLETCAARTTTTTSRALPRRHLVAPPEFTTI